MKKHEAEQLFEAVCLDRGGSDGWAANGLPLLASGNPGQSIFSCLSSPRLLCQDDLSSFHRWFPSGPAPFLGLRSFVRSFVVVFTGWAPVGIIIIFMSYSCHGREHAPRVVCCVSVYSSFPARA